MERRKKMTKIPTPWAHLIIPLYSVCLRLTYVDFFFLTMLLRCDVTMTSSRGVSPDPQVDFLSPPLFSLVTSSSFAGRTTKQIGQEFLGTKEKNSNWMPDDIALATADKQYSQPTTQHWTIGQRGTLVYRWD